MPRPRRLGVRTCRNHRLEVQDDGGQGWSVTIHGAGPDDSPPRRVVLRNAVPNGLEALLNEARRRVDRCLDGSPWQREP